MWGDTWGQYVYLQSINNPVNTNVYVKYTPV